MNIKDFMYDGENKIQFKKVSTNSNPYNIDKDDIIRETCQMISEIEVLQDKLYAEGKEGLILIVQAIDAAGKDSTIKHVMSGVNPQGVNVVSFKQPTSNELCHDFLWRVENTMPKRGYIGIMNRSYYEDVLVVKVHDIQKNYKMPKRCISIDPKEFFEKRYKHIKNYEEYLYDEGYKIVKIFLNVSADKQKERFLERIDNSSKNWKFSASDLKERELWDEYQKAFEDAINSTSTKANPWYVLPADQKWFTRYLVSKILLATLKEINPKYPELSESELNNLAVYRDELMGEKSTDRAVKENKESDEKNKIPKNKKGKKKQNKKK